MTSVPFKLEKPLQLAYTKRLAASIVIPLQMHTMLSINKAKINEFFHVALWDRTILPDRVAVMGNNKQKKEHRK